MPVKDGPNCSGCGLANYEGLCPHCRGDQDAYEAEFAPPYPWCIYPDACSKRGFCQGRCGD